MFEDVFLKKETGKDKIIRKSFFLLSFIIHFSVIVYVMYNHLFVSDTDFPKLKVVDVYLLAKPPSPPTSMRAALKKTQKKTKLVKKEQKVKHEDNTKQSILIVPIEIPGKIVDDEDDLLVSDTDFGAGGGVEGGIEGGEERGVIGGSILGEFVEEEIKPVRLSGNSPKLIKYVKPIYPEEALKFRITGMVMVEITVGKFGKVKKWRVLLVDGHDEFKQAAIDAIKQWRYKPYLVNGKPTPFIISATITFNKMK